MDGNKNQPKRVLFTADQVPPGRVLFFAGLQHMLLVLSLSLALPVSISKAAGMNAAQSSSFLATTLFFMAVGTALQSVRMKGLGCGGLAIATADSAAISPSLLALQAGGMPLVWGMTAFSGALRALISFGTRSVRRFFPPEVTGCSIFILGISLVPTTMKNFLGTGAALSNPYHILVAFLAFIVMLIFAVLMPKFRLYAVLIGVAAGYALSFAFGIATINDFADVAALPVFALPIPQNLSLSFDLSVIIPFIVISLANVIDNIGDFSAVQSAECEKLEKADWTKIANGSRACALSTMLAGLLGGSMMSTATGNIGVTRATGVASRRVAYVTAGLLAACAFMPGVTGVLSMMPQPVLGAVLMYSACYIMAGGYETLTSRKMDDRRVFTVFVSVIAAISALIPNLYAFLPDTLNTLLVSPVTLGVGTLIVMSAFMRIGRKKSFSFTLPATAEATRQAAQRVDTACAEWCAPLNVCQRLKIGVTALLEGIEEQHEGADVRFVASYDEMRILFHVECAKDMRSAEDSATTLDVALMMLRGMFSTVEARFDDGLFTIDIQEDA